MTPTHFDKERICFGDVEITLLTDSNAEDWRRDDLLFMFKSHWYVTRYERLAKDFGPFRNILEVGVARGGSTAFLRHFFDAERIVGVDINPKPPLPLERYRQANPGVIQIFYGTSQADRPRLTEIIESEFPDGIDLIIDDASHRYEESKVTFETAFPYLRAGGLYMIEDWQWSHGPAAQKPDHFYADQLSLTNLVFDLTAFLGSDPHACEQIGIYPSMMWLRRAWKDVPKQGFRVDDHIRTRDKPLPKL